MPLVEPDVSEEKLRQLLAEGHESESLDYKESLNLEETVDRVELAKDVAAMQVDGGFIVIGTNSHGRPTGRLDPAKAGLLDESKLHAVLKKWIPEPFVIRSQCHAIEGGLVGLIYVEARPDGFCVFRADGQYADPGTKKTVCIFRQGDVFIRHGTASERWQQYDIDRIRKRIAESQRAAWLREASVLIERTVREGQAQALAAGPTTALTWRLDEETFRDCVIQYLRTGDKIPLRLFLVGAPREVTRIARDGRTADLEILFSRISCLAATMLLVQEREWFDEAVAALVRIYEQGSELSTGYLVASDPSVRIWLGVAKAALALGALALRSRNWRAVRTLAIQQPSPARQQACATWFRHAITMGSHLQALPLQPSGAPTIGPLIQLARDLVRQHACLRPDFHEDSESLLDSLCQFDLLWNLAAIAATEDESALSVYPSFAGYFARRSTPAVEHLLSDSVMREIILPINDDLLAEYLRRLGRVANEVSFSAGTWTGFDSEVVSSFLKAHPS
jgi:hypothetical protein